MNNEFQEFELIDLKPIELSGNGIIGNGVSSPLEETNFDLFTENLIMYPVLDTFNVVLEVKFNGFLFDYIRCFINNINKSELSVSKYALARQQSYAEI